MTDSTEKNTMELRRLNRNRIFRFLYRESAVSKQQIAHALGMSLPTVSQNVRELMERGLVVESGRLQSTGGRKARALAVCAGARYSLGLDVTRNHVGAVLLNLKGEVVLHRRFKEPFFYTERYFRRLASLLDTLLREAGVSAERVLGVGIGVPAILSADAGRLSYAPALGCGEGVIDDFARYIPLPCTFVNDANAAGFAEAWNFPHRENSVYLSLNNTVGGSILLDNRVCCGENQRAGEFGHMTLVPGGNPCYCGQRGCVDAYCSAAVLSGSTDGSLDQFFALLEQGKPEQTSLWEEYLEHLVLTLNNLRMIFDCDVVVGGYVGAHLQPYLGEIRRRAAQKNTFERNGGYLRVCGYRLEATAVGAALHYIDRFLREI